MKKAIAIPLLLSSSFTFGQSFLWGRQGNSIIWNSSVAIDKKDNAYLCGTYNKVVVFGPDTLHTSGGSTYLVKYNSSGNMLWAVHPIGKEDTNNSLIYYCSDATDNKGNIFWAGTFVDTLIFGSTKLISPGGLYNDVFLAKYDSNGNVLWAKQSVSEDIGLGYGGVGTVYSVATDNKSNSFVTGYFQDSLRFGGFQLYGQTLGNFTVFLTKYDPNGNVLWARQSIGSNTLNGGRGEAFSVSTDKLGNAYITGYFLDSIHFGAFTLYGFDDTDEVFLVKYDSSGNVLWARQSIENSNSDGYSVATDDAGYIYLTGTFYDTIKFGSSILTTNLLQDVFLVKYDKNGNVIWAEDGSAPVGAYWTGYSLSSDANNHIYLAGTGESDSITFGGSSFRYGNLPLYDYHGFIIQLDTSGVALCGSVFPNNTTFDGWIGCATDSTGTCIYLAGSFIDTVYFGRDTLIANIDSNSAYVSRWNPCIADLDIKITFPPTFPISIFPNPNNGKFVIQSSAAAQQSSVEIYNILGERVFAQPLRLNNRGSSIDISNQPSGVYFYRVLTESGLLLGEGKVVLEK